MERLFGGAPGLEEEPSWEVDGGVVHPFRDYRQTFRSKEERYRWSEDLDRQSRELFESAEVVVVTLGLIEAWRHPKRDVFYRQIPHPDVFPSLQPVLHRLTVADIREDLARILEIVRNRLRAEFIYAAVVLDVFSRRVVGWAIGESLETELPLAALEQALEARWPRGELIHHSDRGTQYASHKYVDKLRENGVRISMSRKCATGTMGNRLDRADG